MLKINFFSTDFLQIGVPNKENNKVSSNSKSTLSEIGTQYLSKMRAKWKEGREKKKKESLELQINNDEGTCDITTQSGFIVFLNNILLC